MGKRGIVLGGLYGGAAGIINRAGSPKSPNLRSVVPVGGSQLYKFPTRIYLDSGFSLGEPTLYCPHLVPRPGDSYIADSVHHLAASRRLVSTKDVYLNHPVDVVASYPHRDCSAVDNPVGASTIGVRRPLSRQLRSCGHRRGLDRLGVGEGG